MHEKIIMAASSSSSDFYVVERIRDPYASLIPVGDKASIWIVYGKSGDRYLAAGMDSRLRIQIEPAALHRRTASGQHFFLLGKISPTTGKITSVVHHTLPRLEEGGEENLRRVLALVGNKEWMARFRHFLADKGRHI